MKKLSAYIRNSVLVLVCTFLATLSFGQDKGVDINVDVNKKGDWYQQPWVWIVGGAIFILLLVALLRGGGSKKEG